MKVLMKLKNKLELKRLKREEIDLDGFFENRFEAIAAVGDEYEEVENIEEIKERFDYVVKRIEELKAINKRGWFK